MADRFRNRGSRFLPSSQRRKSEWGAIISVAELSISAPSTKAVMGSTSQAALSGTVPATIVRVRGSFSYRSDQNAADEDYIGAFGIAVVRDVARAAGAASLPGPISDASDDVWLYWTPFVGRQVAATSDHDVYNHIIVDGKAQRKLVDGDAIVFMAETAALSEGVNLLMFLRTLFLLT